MNRWDLDAIEDSAAFRTDVERAERTRAERDPSDYRRVGGRWVDAVDVPDLADVADLS